MGQINGGTPGFMQALSAGVKNASPYAQGPITNNPAVMTDDFGPVTQTGPAKAMGQVQPMGAAPPGMPPAWQSGPMANVLGQLLNGQQGGMPQPIGIPQRQYMPGFSQSPQIGQVQGPAPFAPTPGYTSGTGGGTPGLRPPTQPPAPSPQEQVATWLQNRGGRNPFAGDGIGF